MAFLALIAVLLFGFLGSSQGTSVSKQTLSATTVVVDLRANGQEISLPAAAALELRLPTGWASSRPSASARAGVRHETFLSDPGYDGWIVQPRGQGTVVVHATGRNGKRQFKLTLHVR